MDSQHNTHRGPGIKNWRLIIRNLPFNTTEEGLKQWTCTFGHLLEIVLPKCKDKRFPNSSAGFCFVQFSRRSDAEEAKKHLNFKEFNGRKVAVDWALDKDNYITKVQEKKSAKSIEQTNVKDEPKVETEEEREDELEENRKNGEEGTEEEELKHNKVSQERNSEDNAVTEGRVIFLRNVPFAVDDEKLRKLSEEFGEVRLAILCRNKSTGDPAGTAFIHFREKESADNFLDNLTTEDGLLVEGRRIYGHRAVQRNEAKTFNATDKKPIKDKRNLYLMRASLVRPGTAQAKGMSEEDAKLRQRLMEMARNKLKSLAMFVSPTRLVVHNIPFSWTDTQLKNVCLESVDGCSPSSISECRIMRQLKGQDEKGRAVLGKSSGFGFVSFTEHTLALNCLRKLNNNANAFTDKRRPIIEFSIENLNALKVKGRRQQQKEEAKSGGNEEEKKQRKGGKENAEALEKTKREMMAGGQKWLPNKLGAKIRHKKQQQGHFPSPGARRRDSSLRKRAGAMTTNKNVNVKMRGKRKASRTTDDVNPAKKRKANK